jgi:hypothetical protein
LEFLRKELVHKTKNDVLQQLDILGGTKTNYTSKVRMGVNVWLYLGVTDVSWCKIWQRNWGSQVGRGYIN